jgi:integrase/recombinase XerD
MSIAVICAGRRVAADIARVLAIPAKRSDQTIVTFLTCPETEALLAAPDRVTRTRRRDHAWILLAIQTGLQASELTALTCRDVHLGTGAYVACHGKAAKTGSRPWPPARSPPCAHGSPNTPGHRTTRCSPPSAAGR